MIFLEEYFKWCIKITTDILHVLYSQHEKVDGYFYLIGPYRPKAVCNWLLVSNPKG